MLPTARTVIIVTVSPASKDTEHSLNSLRHACIMDGQSDRDREADDGAGVGEKKKETRFITGGTVTRQEVMTTPHITLLAHNR